MFDGDGDKSLAWWSIFSLAGGYLQSHTAGELGLFSAPKMLFFDVICRTQTQTRTRAHWPLKNSARSTR